MKQVKSLTVVGGGTAGLIAALILKERSNMDVNLVYSSEVGIVGVGEGSTEHFADFMNFVGIKPSELIKECDATFKIGVMFDSWVEDGKYLHSVGYPFSQTFGQYSSLYAKEISDGSNYFYPKSREESVITFDAKDIDITPPTNQYHFNTFKLNEFLQKLAKGKGINLFDDNIVDIQLDENGYIVSVIGTKSIYKSDFYIDATGFKRILMNKLGVKWKSYSQYLKLNSAITFPTGDEENYNFWTLSKAMSSGWRFKIPTWGRHGNGYIYDNNFITQDEAKLEIEKELGYEIEIGKTFKFDPGALDKIWEKNCVAIGLSGVFFEPLEATSIGLSIQQSFLLMHRLQNYDNRVVTEYNESINTVIENIRDFIVLHYLTKRNDTDFWKNISTTEIPESLKYNLEKWKTKIPIQEDFKNISGYSMFGPANFIVVMGKINLFDKESIQNEYNFLANNLKDITNNTINKALQDESLYKYTTHKEIIKNIREMS
jgi:tryptophan halogenase